MPEELRAPLVSAVMEFLGEEGVAEHGSIIRFLIRSVSPFHRIVVHARRANQATVQT